MNATERVAADATWEGEASYNQKPENTSIIFLEKWKLNQHQQDCKPEKIIQVAIWCLGCCSLELRFGLNFVFLESEMIFIFIFFTRE